MYYVADKYGKLAHGRDLNRLLQVAIAHRAAVYNAATGEIVIPPQLGLK